MADDALTASAPRPSPAHDPAGPASAPAAPPGFLAGNSEMAVRARAMDWSGTPVGEPAAWPQSLKTAVSICIGSRYPIVVWWGQPTYTMFYNDGYIPILGVKKHPGWFGGSGRECWSELWPIIGPMFDSVFATGEATWSEDLLLVMDRNVPREENYFTFSYSPIHDDGDKVGGIFCACYETTGRVIGERRLRTLRDLNQLGGRTRTAEEACKASARALGENSYDLPFSLIYLLEEDGGHARLVAATSLEPGSAAAPHRIALRDHTGATATWPLGQVLDAAKAELISDLASRFGLLPGGPWPEPAEAALIVPIAAPGHTKPTGFLVAGLSPRRVIDADYRSYFDLIAGHIGTSVANARAYEEERKRAEALADIDRAKTAFFSNVSHEFRTPLTLMTGPLEDALAGEGLSAANQERLHLAHRNALRLLKLVNTLLDFSRIEAGRIQASYEPTDLAALTADLASVFRSAVERAGMKLTVDCPALPAPIHVDREMWEKIVLNLLSNAFKFTFDGGIAVTLRAAGEAVELAVQDTGTGIPADELPRLFDRFHRVEGARGRSHEGSGIGLSLVQELVKLHGGHVRVESEVDRGSRFIVTVPVGTAHLPADRIQATRTLSSTSPRAATYVEEILRWLPAGPAAAPVGSHHPFPARPAGPPRRVLLADDNADMRDYVRGLLAQQGYEVDAVTDGKAALDQARRQPPDLVLTDVMMPGLDGFGLLRELRADPKLAIIPVILLSARAGEEARIEGIGAGADDYLTKPFSARELVARVESQVRLAQLRRDTTRALHAARDEAVAASRAKDDFLAVLSHELRTPLNPVLLVASEGAADPSLGEEVRGDFKMISDNISLQARLIDDLLDFNRIIHGKVTLEKRALDLHEVARDATATLQEEVAAKRIGLTFSLPPRPCTVDGDPVRLRQVFWNLLKNAVKFTPAGGRIEISSLEGPAGEIELRIRDSGVGINPDELDGIFQPFVQGQLAAVDHREACGGLGLGLAISRTLVELHGGTLTAESPGAGHGSTLIVRLPLKTVTGRRHLPPDGKGSPPVSDSGQRTHRVLFVEDHEPTRTAMTRLLKRRGYEVTIAHSVQDGIRQGSLAPFDALISDLGLPDGDGCELMIELRKKFPNLPGIALSGYGMDGDLLRSRDAGFSEHLIKPVSVDSLDRAMVRLLERSASRPPR